MTSPPATPTRPLVVAANRLPVMRCRRRLLDTEPGWTGARPAADAARRRRGMGGLDRGGRRRRRAVHSRRCRTASGAALAERARRLLRGVFQRLAVAALPRRSARVDVQGPTVGRLRLCQRKVRRAPRRSRPARGRDLGPRLPAPTRPGDGPRASPGYHDRLLPPRPVPSVGAVRTPAVAQRDRRGIAWRRPRRLPAVDGRRELRPHRPASRLARRADRRRPRPAGTEPTHRAR